MSAVLAPPAPAFVPGVAYGMPEAQYHAIPALGSSDIKRLLRSPAHYRAAQDADDEPTEAKLIGTAIHLGALEPGRFAREVIAVPADAPRRPSVTQLGAAKPSPATVEAIAWWREWEARTAGMLVLPPEDFDAARRVIDAVRSHPGAAYLLRDVVTEVVLQWVDEETATPCKARLDALRPDLGCIDLKSSRDASPAGFARAMGQYGYGIQQAHYSAGVRAVLGAAPPLFAFVAVEKDPPYAVGVYVLDDESLAASEARVRDALRRYRDCSMADQWPAYSDLIETITLPKWAI